MIKVFLVTELVHESLLYLYENGYYWWTDNYVPHPFPLNEFTMKIKSKMILLMEIND